MNTLDLEIKTGDSVSGEDRLSHFFNFLEIAVQYTKVEANENCVLNLNTYGRRKKIITAYEIHHLEKCQDVMGYLYFRAHGDDSLKELSYRMKNNVNFRIYLFCHNLFDLLSEYKKILEVGIDRSRITFVFSKHNQNLSFHSNDRLKKTIEDIKYNEVYFLNPQTKVKKDDAVVSVKQAPIFYFIFKLAQIMLQPIKSLSLLLQKSNLLWLLRLKELFDFSLNLINSVRFILMMSGFKSFGLFVDSYQFVRVGIIRGLFFIRHLLLMSGFKSFGLFVDSYQFVRAIFIRASYLVRHFFLMAGYKSFGVAVDTYYNVRLIMIRFLYFTRHVILMTCYKTYGGSVDFYHLMRMILIRSYFVTRHILLMTGFKGYGLIVDTYYFLKSILNQISQVLFYPVLKIYWFTSYQYAKRIKKSFQK